MATYPIELRERIVAAVDAQRAKLAATGLSGYFEHILASGDVKVAKPDAAIFRHSLAGLGVAADESLFVDDRAVNVEGARAVGMFGIQFHSTTQLREELAKLEFPVLPPSSN
jgi:HAD superfamily hydrolase (TIGR01509 family)